MTETPQTRSSQRKTLIGVVTGARMNKTRRVEVTRLVKHPKYGKFLRQRTVCHTHDEENRSREGDQVEIMETRPLSRLKRWRLVRIVRPAAVEAEPEADASAQESSDRSTAANG